MRSERRARTCGSASVRIQSEPSTRHVLHHSVLVLLAPQERQRDRHGEAVVGP